MKSLTDALQDHINKKPNGFHIFLAATNTVASLSDPNLQNIPIKTSDGKNKKAFIAEKNSILISADYNQIEMKFLLTWRM